MTCPLPASRLKWYLPLLPCSRTNLPLIAPPKVGYRCPAPVAACAPAGGLNAAMIPVLRGPTRLAEGAVCRAQPDERVAVTHSYQLADRRMSAQRRCGQWSGRGAERVDFSRIGLGPDDTRGYGDPGGSHLTEPHHRAGNALRIVDRGVHGRGGKPPGPQDGRHSGSPDGVIAPVGQHENAVGGVAAAEPAGPAFPRT